MGSASNTPSREPWNKGKIVGQKAPFKVKDIGHFASDQAWPMFAISSSAVVPRPGHRMPDDKHRATRDLNIE